MTYKQILHDAQYFLFKIFTALSYILLIISAFGMSDQALIYLNTVSYYIRIYTCLFLIWRFNPLRQTYEFTELDRNIAFTAGVFILSTTALNKYIEYIKNTTQTVFKKVSEETNFH